MMHEFRRGREPMRVLVVDDSPTSRVAIVSAIRRLPEMSVVDSVADIASALAVLRTGEPQVVTVDKQLDGEDGLDLIDIIHRDFPDIIPVLVTAMTPEQVGPALDRLSDSPVEFLGKPARGSSFDEWVEGPLSSTLERVRRSVSGDRRFRTGSWTVPDLNASRWPDLILVGASTGGPKAVRTFLEHLPTECTAPVVITQHMPKVFTRVFSDQLDRRLERSVYEAQEGDILRPGGVWISPGDQHLTLSRHHKTWTTHLDSRPELHGCRPAVDHLFSSVADQFAGLVGVVVLTGMGVDGMTGCQRLRHSGGQNVRIIVQDKASSAVWGMPGAVASAGIADETGTPEQLGELLEFNLNRKGRQT